MGTIIFLLHLRQRMFFKKKCFSKLLSGAKSLTRTDLFLRLHLGSSERLVRREGQVHAAVAPEAEAVQSAWCRARGVDGRSAAQRSRVRTLRRVSGHLFAGGRQLLLMGGLYRSSKVLIAGSTFVNNIVRIIWILYF